MGAADVVAPLLATSPAVTTSRYIVHAELGPLIEQPGMDLRGGLAPSAHCWSAVEQSDAPGSCARGYFVVLPVVALAAAVETSPGCFKASHAAGSPSWRAPS